MYVRVCARAYNSSAAIERASELFDYQKGRSSRYNCKTMKRDTRLLSRGDRADYRKAERNGFWIREREPGEIVVLAAPEAACRFFEDPGNTAVLPATSVAVILLSRSLQRRSVRPQASIIHDLERKEIYEYVSGLVEAYCDLAV